MMLASLTVLQLGDVGDARGQLHAAFVAEALPASVPEADGCFLNGWPLECSGGW